MNHEHKIQNSVKNSKYFIFQNKNNFVKDITVVCGGFEKYSKDFELKRQSYPYYVLELPTNGKCSLTIDKNEFLLEKGKIAGFAPGIWHHYECDKVDPLEHIFVIFTGYEAKNFFDECPLKTKKCINLPNPGEINYLMRAILKHGLQKSEHSHELCNYYLRVLLLELASTPEDIDKSDSLANKTYNECINFIEENFAQITSTREVADACQINPQYLSRLFKRYNQFTPQEYINRLKMNKASVLLLTTQQSIGQIGELIGYDDQYHFSRNFKKYHGISPRAYREIHTNLLVGEATKEIDIAC